MRLLGLGPVLGPVASRLDSVLASGLGLKLADLIAGADWVAEQERESAVAVQGLTVTVAVEPIVAVAAAEPVVGPAAVLAVAVAVGVAALVVAVAVAAVGPAAVGLVVVAEPVAVEPAVAAVAAVAVAAVEVWVGELAKIVLGDSLWLKGDEEGLAEAARSAEALGFLPGCGYWIAIEHVAWRLLAAAASVDAAVLVDVLVPWQPGAVVLLAVPSAAVVGADEVGD